MGNWGESKKVRPKLGWLFVCLIAAVLGLVTCAPPLPTAAPIPTAPPGNLDLAGKIDQQGKLLTDVELISSDGRARLSLAKGTRVLDAKGQPAKLLTVNTRQPQASESADALLVGLAYDFGGGTVDPLGQLTISYDPPPATTAINAQDPRVGGFATEKKAWVDTNSPSTADLKARIVTTRVGTLGTFAVLFWLTVSTPPISRN